jgi:hypothetical protein
MGELKSAWEIAQERASRLGKLSVEEEKQQARQRYRQIGQVLSQKWLDSPQPLDLTAELNKHREEDREGISQAVIEHLVEAVEITPTQSTARVRRAIEGVTSLESQLQPEVEGIAGLLQEYEEAEGRTRQQLESSYWETLHQLRISGSAVGAINLEANEQWQLARQRLVEAFAPRLDDLKRKLTTALESRATGHQG